MGNLGLFSIALKYTVMVAFYGTLCDDFRQDSKGFIAVFLDDEYSVLKLACNATAVNPGGKITNVLIADLTSDKSVAAVTPPECARVLNWPEKDIYLPPRPFCEQQAGKYLEILLLHYNSSMGRAFECEVTITDGNISTKVAKSHVTVNISQNACEDLELENVTCTKNTSSAEKKECCCQSKHFQNKQTLSDPQHYSHESNQTANLGVDRILHISVLCVCSCLLMVLFLQILTRNLSCSCKQRHQHCSSVELADQEAYNAIVEYSTINDTRTRDSSTQYQEDTLAEDDPLYSKITKKVILDNC